jgi:hypothetical protein
MPIIFTRQNREGMMIVKDAESYRMNIRSAARAFWNGSWDWYDFYAQMMMAIDRAFLQAWLEGMASQGMTLDDMNEEERLRLNQEIVGEKAFVPKLADFIERNQKSKGKKLSLVMGRVEHWLNNYRKITQIAITYAAKDKKIAWRMRFAKEHCESCKKLNGKVKRASWWREHDIYPKHWSRLDCRNGCHCEFEETSEPLSRGAMPSLP